MARTTAGTTPATSPGRPAWAAAATPETGSASRTGTQSAVRTARARPRSAVTTASTRGTGRSPQGPSTTATSAPCTWFIQTTRAGSTPSDLAATPVGQDGGGVVTDRAAEVELLVRNGAHSAHRSVKPKCAPFAVSLLSYHFRKSGTSSSSAALSE
ncbi:hypothetical protein SVIOM342S_06383 [Streptomyces violaceorubidus]